MEKLLELCNISKSFNKELVLDEFNLYVKRNEFVTLLGPSGCGKTTALRIIGGFEKPDRGSVFFEGKDIRILLLTNVILILYSKNTLFSLI